MIAFFNFRLNYPGLRFETLSFRKIFKAQDCNISIICFGDSNTFGWNRGYLTSYPVLLENKIKACQGNAKVINCGIGGNTIKDAAQRLQDDVLFFKPKIVIINFGFNDARLFKLKRNINTENKSNPLYSLNNENYTLKVGKKEFGQLLENIIEKLQKNHADIILTGLYKINKIKTGIFFDDEKQLVDLQNKVYKEYDVSIKEISRKKNTLFLDLWNKFDDYGEIKSYFQKDGFHLGDEGCKLIADNLSDIIIKNCLLK
ncbi:MAG: SGNH/GDSL hydrolase family protein [Candidatus Humimicrobiaceae bacterium]